MAKRISNSAAVAHISVNHKPIERQLNPSEPIEDFIRLNTLSQLLDEIPQSGSRMVSTAKPRSGKQNPTPQGTGKRYSVAGAHKTPSVPKNSKKRSRPKYRVAKTSM